MFEPEFGVFKTEMKFPDTINNKAQHRYHN